MSIFSSDFVKSTISASISDTAVDVFIYDTSKDSDGGAWRKRTTDTSWYNETLGTATRGSRKEFPSVAVIVAETTQLTIYDGDDPDLPLWMRFTCSGAVGVSCNMITRGGSGSESDITSVACLNAKLIVGLKDVDGTVGEGLIEVNFIPDYARVYREAASGLTGAIYNQPISKRNIGTGLYLGDYNNLAILDQNVLDVDMIVRPNAPVDVQTGLPIPTIATGSYDGISVIKDDGTTDLKNATNVDSYASKVQFTKDGNIIAVRNNFNYIIVTPIDGAQSSGNISGFAANVNYFRSGSTNDYPAPNGNYGDQSYGLANQIVPVKVPSLASGDPSGLNIFDVDRSLSSNKNMVAYITSTYNTGYQVGNIILALLSDTDTTDKTNGQTDPDRSYKLTPISVVGTITKSVVATGATMVGYSGFSTSNVLTKSYTSSLDPGTGDYSFAVWFKCTATSAEQVIMRRFSTSSVTGGMIMRLISSTSKMQWYVRDTSGSNTQLSSIAALDDGVWHCAVGTREGGTSKLYIDGILNDSAGCSVNSHNPGNDANFVLGAEENVGSAGTYGNPASACSLALVRYALCAPTASQVKKMYADESCLFKENAKCTLYGSSNTVTTLDYDEVTDQLHVGTSSGRSDFQGLRRINNTTTAVTTAISAHDEFIIEQ